MRIERVDRRDPGDVINRRLLATSEVRLILGGRGGVGTGPHKFTVVYSRVIAIVVGSPMAVIGFLVAFGVR
jgi:hypothetical protein